MPKSLTSGAGVEMKTKD